MTSNERLLTDDECTAIEEKLPYWNPGQPSWMIPGRGSYECEVQRQMCAAQDAKSYAAGVADTEAKYAELLKEALEASHDPQVEGILLAVLKAAEEA